MDMGNPRSMSKKPSYMAVDNQNSKFGKPSPNPRGNTGGFFGGGQKSGGNKGGFFQNQTSGNNPRGGAGNGFGNPSLMKGPSSYTGNSKNSSGMIFGAASQAASGGMFGGGGQTKNISKLAEMLGQDQNEEKKGEDNSNLQPPKIKETETSKLMLAMGFTSMQSKIYSDNNDALENENIFSFDPPTKAQI
eukprot:CAMPEP_0205820722 /NCGR_PEP_ID=MMETSP0206-20130828/3382_1 /ASSEMBLY_ACC=CAM_ASM_000279 /TAXON_ID=36767 /ORGANISM="Euplotes focardii, Strain TN1" /LENGTH=189 /DNA_ID=CAMNT_0053115695 /DNA_START=62 /DNA_END=631 /DNA_ORIENTATION=-